MIKGIIFDMDGVLVDAKMGHYHALNRALQSFGCDEISLGEHKETYDGLPTKKKLELLSITRKLPYEWHNWISHLKQKYTQEFFDTQYVPNETHQNTLCCLKDKGYVLGLASNSIRKTVNSVVEKMNITSCLDVILSNNDVVRPKPSPEIYIKAMTHLGILPTECLVLEDNKHGIEAAQAALAHVMVIQDITDVVLDNILSTIRLIENNK